MSNPRAAILARLRAAPPKPTYPLPDWQPFVSPVSETALDRFCRMMAAVKGEIVKTSRADLAATLQTVLKEKGARNLLYGRGTELASALEATFAPGAGPELVAYDRPIEEMKALMMNDIDAGITTTKGAIAETGSLIVWPSANEPRLMSLVPPIHVAVLEAGAVFDSFTEAVRALEWDRSPPGNTLLISGPSKTADIEGILCFGVHGPKQLVVLVVTD